MTTETKVEAAAWAVVVNGEPDFADIRKLECEREAAIFGDIAGTISIEPLYPQSALGSQRGEKSIERAHIFGRLNEVQRYALDGVIGNLEHDAGDVDDLPPSRDKDEDGYWAYHAWHAINILRGGHNSHTTPQPGAEALREGLTEEDVAVLRRLKAALPTVGLNGWMTGVRVLEKLESLLARGAE